MPEDNQSVGTVEFIEFHKPGLTDGDYEIVVTQKLSTTDQKIREADATFTSTRNFTVAGERFDLKPADVHAVFPPDGNLGDHSNVLPHIILNRSTLPWERRAEAETAGAEEEISDLPWLTLLLFDESEKPLPRLGHLTLTDQPSIILEPSTDPPFAGKFPRLLAKGTLPGSSEGLFLELESGQNEGDKLTVIDVKKSLLVAIMPTANELPLLAHVRMGKDPDEDPTGEESAVIISNRLPQKNQSSTAHLVSIEGRFKKGSEGYEFDYQAAGDDDLVRLVSLKSWTFACEDPDKTFKQILLNLNEGGTPPSTLRLPEKANVTNDPRAKKLLSKGYVLVPHYLRHGDKTASWYHGPLIPGESTAPEISLPIRTADELVRYDPDIGMFDVSYAAAWELGRLLSLQSKAFSTSLYQWKRQHAQQLAQEEQQVSHLPFQKTPGEAQVLPDAISAGFERLRNLEGIPFNYLVPDERMLPVESIRFFRVDDRWVGCLLDGAFSTGRVTSSEHTRDQSRGPNKSSTKDPPPITGFLLRSEVVSGWPGLQVDAYADQMGDPPSDRRSLTMVRMERLAPNVLICLFEGETRTVEIHQKPETLHFGFDDAQEKKAPASGLCPEGPSGYYKQLRDTELGGPLINRDKCEVNVELDASKWSASKRTINVSSLAQSIAQQITEAGSQPSTPPSEFTSAQFALQMIEGVQKVIFLAEPQQ